MKRYPLCIRSVPTACLACLLITGCASVPDSSGLADPHIRSSETENKPIPTRIVDFGHDFLRDGDSFPVHQYDIHRWRPIREAGLYSAETPVVIDRSVDVDGDGETSDDSIAAYPLSLEEPLSPRAPWYDQKAGSPHFYGGIVFRFANEPNGRLTEAGINQDHDGPSHHPRDNWTLFYELFDLHGAYQGHALYVWRKQDFLLGGDTHRVSFDADSELSLTLQRYFMGFEGCRWVVRNGEQFYVSEPVFKGAGPRRGSGHGKIHTIRPMEVKWAEYNPGKPYNLMFDSEKAAFETVTFDHVTAVGWYLFKDTMAPAYTGFKWYAFEATANVHRPQRPSEFIEMKLAPSTEDLAPFYAATTETSYELWKNIHRRAVSNAFAAGPRGFTFDSDGDMGAMALLDGPHSPAEPVTQITIHDAAVWCNALSAFEMREPVYYLDSTFREPLSRVTYSRLIRNRLPFPPIHVKWAADGYRLPTVSEWLALGPEGEPTSPRQDRTSPVGPAVRDGAASPHGFHGLTHNARELVWSFGDLYAADSGQPVFVMGGHEPLQPVFRPDDRPNRHPLAGFRMVRREPGLPPPPRRDPNAVAWVSLLPAAQDPGPATELPGMELVPISAEASIGKYEVTYRQWQHVYRWAVARGYRFDRDGDMGSMDYWGFGEPPSDPAHHPDEPVTDITIYDAMVWCNALSEMQDLRPVYYTDESMQTPYRVAERYRPFYMTLYEAQLGSRAGELDLNYRAALVHPHIDSKANGYRLPTTDHYISLLRREGQHAWGDELETGLQHAWVFDNSNGRTHRVGRLSPTPPGIYDIAGNVSELTEPVPHGRSGWSAGQHAGRAGGSFFDPLSNTSDWPALQPRGIGYVDLGMRVLLHHPQPEESGSVKPADSPPPEAVPTTWKAPSLQGQTVRGNQQRTGVVSAKGVDSNPAIAWRLPIGAPVRSSPVVIDGVIYVGTHANRFLAVRLDDGKILWQIETEGPVSGSATVHEGVVYFVSEAGTLYAAGQGDGRVHFQTKVSEGRPAGTPAIVGEWIFVATGNAGGSDQIRMGSGPLVGVDRHTGEVTWRGPAGPQGFAAPAVDDKTVYTGLGVNQSGAIQIETRRPRWRYYPGGQDRQWVNPILLGDRVIIIGSITGSISAVSRENGQRIWREFIWPEQVSINNGGSPGYEILAAPAAYEGMILVPGNNGVLLALSVGAADRIWQYKAEGPIQCAPVIGEGTLYVGDNAGFLHAIDPLTGQRRWRMSFGARIASSPWPAAGMLVFGTDGGELIALKASRQDAIPDPAPE